jgi:hypothetical protein
MSFVMWRDEIGLAVVLPDDAGGAEILYLSGNPPEGNVRKPEGATRLVWARSKSGLEIAVPTADGGTELVCVNRNPSVDGRMTSGHVDIPSEPPTVAIYCNQPDCPGHAQTPSEAAHDKSSLAWFHWECIHRCSAEKPQ